MKRIIAVLVFLHCLASPCFVLGEPEVGKHWALLIAGSSSWYNYRHQADVCHAYQVLHKHGIPDERIVVMMYDDIANNTMNPTPGVIINHPNGTNVYPGVPKDYTGRDVTPETFINVLIGNAAGISTGSGKVIASGPNDHVFVYFADHGAPGLIAFPHSQLHASDLIEAIRTMNSLNQYKQMVLYIEACESGSMFTNLLPEDWNVFATTAANSHESSYACYMDDKRHTFLGDVYSVKWLEDSDMEDLAKETLHQQFKLVRSETNTSHVQQFGDRTLAKETLSNFQGKMEAKPIILPKADLTPVPSEEVPMYILQHRQAASPSHSERAALQKEIDALKQSQTDIKKSMQSIVAMVTDSLKFVDEIMLNRYDLVNHSCYKPAVEVYDQYCYDLSKHDYALRQLYALVNLCEEGYAPEEIQDAVKKVCQLHLF